MFIGYVYVIKSLGPIVWDSIFRAIWLISFWCLPEFWEQTKEIDLSVFTTTRLDTLHTWAGQGFIRWPSTRMCVPSGGLTAIPRQHLNESLPSKYQPNSTLIDFSDHTKTGISKLLSRCALHYSLWQHSITHDYGAGIYMESSHHHLLIVYLCFIPLNTVPRYARTMHIGF